MPQDSTPQQQATITTECPVCGVHAWIEAPTCPACGTSLRPTESDDLFTTEAVDNAEVVPAEPVATRDQLWAVRPDAAAPDSPEAPDEVLEAELVEEEPLDDLWEPAGPPDPADGGTGTFSPEPSASPRDVLDVEEVPDDGLWDTSAPEPAQTSPDRPLFVAPGAPPSERSPDPAEVDESAPGLWDQVDAARPAPPGVSVPTPSPADPNGLAGALGRLDAAAVDRAAVPLAVVAVLLGDDEVVEAAVVGDMLGHPAALVLTGSRVVVANGRRWSPVVDVFAVDGALGVRGRHDGGVAALTLMDDERVVTVDGIEDVPLAMHLAGTVRSRTGR